MTADACESQGLSRGAGRRAALLAVVIVVTGMLIVLADVPVARLIYENTEDTPAWIESIFDGAGHYGQAFSALLAFLLMLSLDRRRRTAAVILVVAILATAAVTTLLKPIMSRSRPYIYFETGRMWWLFKGFVRSDYCSLPSAHTASAFALSAALSRNYPRGARVFFLAAGLCGLSRLIDGQHYVSDVFLGAAIGTWVGNGVYRWRWSARAADGLLRADAFVKEKLGILRPQEGGTDTSEDGEGLKK